MSTTPRKATARKIATRKPRRSADFPLKTRRELTEQAMKRAAEKAFSLAFDVSMNASLAYNYPGNTYRFLQMFLRTLEEQLESYRSGSGVKP